MTAAASAFVWPLRVYYEDTDAQGVVYYANYFRFLERARTEWLRACGIEQDDLLREARRIFVVVDLAAKFLKPARFNDRLTVRTELRESSRASFLLSQTICREDAADEMLLSCDVRAACLDADSMKPKRLPEFLLTSIKA